MRLMVKTKAILEMFQIYQVYPMLFDGTCEGNIEFAPRGNGGFGYDPLFVPEGFKESFAELGEDVKNRLSHRAKALAKLKAVLRA